MSTVGKAGADFSQAAAAIIDFGAARQIFRFFLVVFVCAGIAVAVWSVYASRGQVEQVRGVVEPVTSAIDIRTERGGVINDVTVREGQVVERGAVLVRLRNPVDLQRLESRRLELAMARFEIAIIEALLASGQVPSGNDVGATHAEHQERLDYYRYETQARMSSRDEISNEIRALSAELEENTVLSRRSKERRDLHGDLLADYNSLFRNGYVSRTAMIELQDRFDQARSEVAALAHRRSGLEARLASLQDRRANLIQRWHTADLQRLSTLRTDARRLDDEIIADEERLRATMIRADRKGVVATLENIAPGTVVQPGQKLMSLVPTGVPLVFSAVADPDAVGFIVPGQTAQIELDTFPRRLYGDIEGIVLSVEPMAFAQQSDVQGQFGVRLCLKDASVKIGEHVFAVRAGMAGLGRVKVGDATMLQRMIGTVTGARYLEPVMAGPDRSEDLCRPNPEAGLEVVDDMPPSFSQASRVPQ